ncbi:diguanylate cyclase [Rhizobium metallidurans]|uniref:diguanylate cyclase n=1 Tax=Rhizobium metallidurans TaxID=1265931 RepID=A0A7W6GAP5_9HYPH|nr:diguanylate cyclase [Rhizobium metallidurans]MBB3962831.1 diguanylate cyclase (GGDEF)-like protein/PAS domain S-box-containing protein [Rhizobium metallidurans]
MNATWQILLGNLAITALAISLWSHAYYHTRALSERRRNQAFGIAMGLGAICSMMLAVPLDQGVFVDLRYTLVAVSALFGGPFSVLLTIVIASVFRLSEGGSGAIDGVTSICIVGMVGLCGYLIVRRRKVRLADAAVLGIAVSATLLVVMSLLTSQANARAVELVGFPITILNFLSIVIAAFVLIQFERMAHDRDILSAALTQTPDFHYVKNREGKFVIVNKNVAEHHHYPSPAAMVGASDFQLATQRRAEMLHAEEQALMESGRSQLDKIEYLTENGQERCYSTSKVPLRDRTGTVIGLAGATRDVTEERKIEQELRESKDLLSLAMAGMSDGFAMFDRAGTLVFSNTQYASLFPLSGEVRVPGTNIRDILKKVVESNERRDFRQDVTDEWLSEASAALFFDKDEHIELHDGHWLSLRTRVADNGMALVAVSDITTMKQAEFALRTVAEQMKSLAETDALTGLLNRRAFDHAISVAVERSRLERRPMAVLMIDVDRFKAYNDTYGHPEGDECLKAIADCLRRTMNRPQDVLARFGGEEFVVLLPDTDETKALALAEQFRQTLLARAIAHSGSEYGVVTASIGIAVKSNWKQQMRASELVLEADQGLYQAKRDGRNQAVLWSPQRTSRAAR